MKFGLNFFPSFRPGDGSTAEYFGQCEWAGPGGRGVGEVRIRQLPRGQWHPVEPASVCGAIRL